MADALDPPPRPARRGFLKAGGAAVAAGLAAASTPAARAADTPAPAPDPHDGIEPFYGKHQGGITKPQQRHAYFAALDLTTTQRADVIALLKTWTDAAARMTRGETAQPLVTTGGDDVAP
ncbi:deferrochelatase/peroxidase EfeB, partial [Paraburkholderia sp. Se-20369]|nr:deferrochelatase/peroxidase EfeB [Paraburkholderia sp. Se-20369]